MTQLKKIYRSKQSIPLTHEQLDANFRLVSFIELNEYYIENEFCVWHDTTNNSYSWYICKQNHQFTDLNLLTNPSLWKLIGISQNSIISGDKILIGTPTDSFYGPSPSGPSTAGLQPTDKLPDALDKIDTLLAKLIPPKPSGISSQSITFSPGGRYTAFKSEPSSSPVLTPGESYNNIYNIQSGTYSLNINSNFSSGDSGTIIAERILDNSETVSIGQINLTPSSTIPQTNTSLQVTNLELLPITSPFWPTVRANISGINLSSLLEGREYTFRIRHTNPIGSQTDTFRTDRPAVPSIVSLTSVTNSSVMSRRVSGVPSLNNNQTIEAFNVTLGGVISDFYRNIIGEVKFSNTFDDINIVPNGIPTKGTNQTFINVKLTTGSANRYVETPSIQIRAINSQNTASAWSNLNFTNIRIDTISNESLRRTSGSGEFPVSGYGNTYNSSQSLLDNEELQLVGGVYKYPTGNYTAYGGPDYSTISLDWRWATFNIGSVNNNNFIFFTIQGIDGTWNFNSDKLVVGSDFKIYLKVDGSSPTAGWINCNSPYSSGDPTNNGDAAFDISGTTPNPSPSVGSNIRRRITFGSIGRTGNVYVRIGLRKNSNKTFKGVINS